jgi:hypothetical protein
MYLNATPRPGWCQISTGSHQEYIGPALGEIIEDPSRLSQDSSRFNQGAFIIPETKLSKVTSDKFKDSIKNPSWFHPSSNGALMTEKVELEKDLVCCRLGIKRKTS